MQVAEEATARANGDALEAAGIDLDAVDIPEEDPTKPEAIILDSPRSPDEIVEELGAHTDKAISTTPTPTRAEMRDRDRYPDQPVQTDMTPDEVRELGISRRHALDDLRARAEARRAMQRASATLDLDIDELTLDY